MSKILHIITFCSLTAMIQAAEHEGRPYTNNSEQEPKLVSPTHRLSGSARTEHSPAVQEKIKNALIGIPFIPSEEPEDESDETKKDRNDQAN